MLHPLFTYLNTYLILSFARRVEEAILKLDCHGTNKHQVLKGIG